MEEKAQTENAPYCVQEDSSTGDWMELPLCSVIVLCYKNRNLLNGMLDSIFQQDYPNIQLIVSDDGSDDFFAEDVNRYIRQNKTDNIRDVIVMKNPENMGTVRHVAKVLKEASGEFVVFTAADDRFNNDSSFSLYCESFLRQPDKLWLVARCNILTPDYRRSIYVTPTESDLPFFHSGDSVRLFSRWARRGMAIPCSMAFRREAFDVVGGIDLDYFYLEDWPLVLKLLRAGHAPIFLATITAVHSAGGVTNSNQRYGLETRRRFFEDKELVFKKEVEPYLDLLTPEDLDALKTYRREIMERNYFLDITWAGASRKQKLKILLSGQHLGWIIEKKFEQFGTRIQKKKMLLLSQILIALSVVLLSFQGNSLLYAVYSSMGLIDLSIGILLILIALASYPIHKIVQKNQEKRKSIVN